MKAYEYNDVTVNVPEGWHEVTVGTYDRIWPLKPTTARERVEVIAIACDTTVEVLLQWPIEAMNLVLRDMDFLFTNNPAAPSSLVKVDGQDYYVPIDEKLTFGEYIDVDHIQNNSDAILSNVLAIICRPVGESYDPDNNDKRAQMFAALPMSEVQGVLAFFLHNYILLTQYTRLLGSLRELADLLPRNIKDLLKNGGTIKLLRIWQVMKYGVLMTLLRARLRRYSRFYFINGIKAPLP